MKKTLFKQAALILASSELMMLGMTPPPAQAQVSAETPSVPEKEGNAVEETAPAAPNYKVQVNGLVDVYYQYQFHNPKFPGKPNNLGGPRVYDVRHNAPAISMVELNVFQNPRPSGFGWKAMLFAGDAAEINHYNFPPGGPGDGKNESRFKNIQQLYGTYLFDQGGSIDFGKFLSPFGYELTESSSNYNYSHSLPWFFIPSYHSGFKYTTPDMNGFIGSLYLVRSVFNTATAGVQDDNGSPAFVGNLTFTDPKGKYVAITNLGLGKDKIGGVSNKIVLSDNNLTYNLSPTITLGANYLYSRQSPDGGGPKNRANGYTLYFRQGLTDKTAYALRFSGVNNRITGTPKLRVNEVTATYEIRPASQFVTKFEFRHDWSNQQVFLGSDSLPSEKAQDTLSVSGVYKF